MGEGKKGHMVKKSARPKWKQKPFGSIASHRPFLIKNK